MLKSQMKQMKKYMPTPETQTCQVHSRQKYDSSNGVPDGTVTEKTIIKTGTCCHP